MDIKLAGRASAGAEERRQRFVTDKAVSFAGTFLERLKGSHNKEWLDEVTGRVEEDVGMRNHFATMSHTHTHVCVCVCVCVYVCVRVCGCA